MNIVEKYISFNRSNRSLNPVGIVLHETATPGATDEAENQYFNTGYRGASAHAFVDWDSITVCVPYNEVAWHAGPTANSMFLGIELCRPSGHDEDLFKKVWDNAVEYFAYLFINVVKANIVTRDNLMSHAEVSLKWGETDHLDPNEYFAEYGRTVDGFRGEVQAKINETLNGGIKKVKNIVIHGGGADERAAAYLADYLQCPTIHKDNSANVIKDVENIYVVGGSWKPNDKAILISGSDRFETIKAVLKFIGR